MLVHCFDPDAILLGTIVGENPDLFLDDLRERVHARIWPSFREVRIEPGLLGRRRPAYAALCVAALEPPDLSPEGGTTG